MSKNQEYSFTGQKIVEVKHFKEYVVCAACGDEEDLISVNGNGYFDRTIKHGEHTGAYVHRHCLSEERKNEIKENKS
jgi:hypothetical protein